MFDDHQKETLVRGVLERPSVNFPSQRIFNLGFQKKKKKKKEQGRHAGGRRSRFETEGIKKSSQVGKSAVWSVH